MIQGFLTAGTTTMWPALIGVIFLRGGRFFFYQRKTDLFSKVMKKKYKNLFQISPNWFTSLVQVNDENWVYFTADLTMPQFLKNIPKINTHFFTKRLQKVEFTEEEKKKDLIGTKMQYVLTKYVHNWSADPSCRTKLTHN